MFLQGFVSPLWLNHIGSKFAVDPEFYFRHLDFSSMLPSPEHSIMMSLPSIGEIVRIRITSTISWNSPHHPYPRSTKDLRSFCKRHMHEYINNLLNEKGVAPGDSIIRRFSVHDKSHFSIEQMVSVHINHDHPGWLGT